MNTRLLTFRNTIRFFTKGDTKALVREHNDLFCLFLSQIVYFSDSFILKHLTELGCDSVELVEYEGPTSVCIHLDGITYVSVKGLGGRKKREWPIVLNFFPRVYNGTKVHRGFASATRKLHPRVHSFVSQYASSPLVLTGHSMGGAISALLGISFVTSRVVTFGAPKTVKRDLRDVFVALSITNYRINTDIVTYLPPILFKRPGEDVVKNRKLSLWKLWDSHKLFAYSEHMLPVIAPSIRSLCR